MDNYVLLCALYDYYKNLLTDKQKKYFEAYYFQNLSLSEISENELVSRNAIHKNIRECENKLYNFEEKLQLYKKGKQIKKIISNLDNNIKEKINRLI